MDSAINMSYTWWITYLWNNSAMMRQSFWFLMKLIQLSNFQIIRAIDWLILSHLLLFCFISMRSISYRIKRIHQPKTNFISKPVFNQSDSNYIALQYIIIFMCLVQWEECWLPKREQGWGPSYIPSSPPFHQRHNHCRSHHEGEQIIMRQISWPGTPDCKLGLSWSHPWNAGTSWTWSSGTWSSGSRSRGSGWSGFRMMLKWTELRRRTLDGMLEPLNTQKPPRRRL